MKFFANIQNEKLNGGSQLPIVSDNIFQIEITEEIFNNIEKYEYKNGEIVKIENYEEKQQKEQRKSEILAELDTIDLKSIRALRSEEHERLTELEQQAETLREELRGL